MRLGRVEERREEAADRKKARESLTDAQQLESLKSRGHGHCREANRFLGRIRAAEQERQKKAASKKTSRGR